MRKVVVLNSGGFDSIVLLYHLVKTKCDGLLEDEEIEFHSLHFTYFEKNFTFTYKTNLSYNYLKQNIYK